MDIYNHALEAVKPDNLISKALRFDEDTLTIRSANLDVLKITDIKNKRLHVIGGGKSVLGMACGLARAAQHSGVSGLFSCGLLSLPIGLRSSFVGDHITQKLLSSISTKCLFGSENNLPDVNSVLASESIMRSIELACQDDTQSDLESLFLVLLSGGGSACLTSPNLISLDEKLKLINHLVQRGANIAELNKARQYFSSIKGGRLARRILSLAPKAYIVSLILSDVVDDPIESIASGPTFISSSDDGNLENNAMRTILTKYNYDMTALPMDRSLESSSACDATRTFNCIVGNNSIALSAARSRAEDLGYPVKLLGNNIQGSSREIVDRLVEIGRKSFHGNGVLVLAGGEATVSKLPGERWGKGGRLQEMAVDYLIKRSETTSEKESDRWLDMFLVGSTDGQDGPTDVSACVISHEELLSESLWCDDFVRAARESKIAHDTYHFWNNRYPGCLIKTGLTGTNVMDIFMYLVRERSDKGE